MINWKKGKLSIEFYSEAVNDKTMKKFLKAKKNVQKTV